MESRKKSILIALVLGDGSITVQKKMIKGKVYSYANFEVTHSHKQKEYIEWKANLCRSITGKKCNINAKSVKERIVNGRCTPELIAYRFTCCHKYFRILHKWIYVNKHKLFTEKYLKHLDAQGLAIWYMDNGCTYIYKHREKCFSCELSTHIPKDEALSLCEYFKKYWNISFKLHKKAENQFNLRCHNDEAFKFIKIISPFVPKCMDYKVKVPNYYIQERQTSFKQDDDVF